MTGYTVTEVNALIYNKQKTVEKGYYMRKIILASASPRRRASGGARCYFSGMLNGLRGKRLLRDKPEEIVRELSEQKATAVALNFDVEEGTVVIGADTIVSYNNEILGKPVDESGRI